MQNNYDIMNVVQNKTTFLFSKIGGRKMMRNIINGVVFDDTYELSPVDGRKSFYGKAKVLINNESGTRYLLSYDTIVASKTSDGRLFSHWDGWSATTGRHIKAFCGLNKKEFLKQAIDVA